MSVSRTKMVYITVVNVDIKFLVLYHRFALNKESSGGLYSVYTIYMTERCIQMLNGERKKQGEMK